MFSVDWEIIERRAKKIQHLVNASKVSAKFNYRAYLKLTL